jgi:hypothetical protein
VTLIKSACAALLLVFAGSALADAPAIPNQPSPSAPQAAQVRPERAVRFVAQMDLDHQFNKFATVTFTDGSKADLGDAIVGLAMGAAVPLTSDRQFEAQGLVGVRYARAGASNGDITYLEFPIEVTAHVNLGRFRLGAGPALHLGPKLSGSGIAATVDAKFETAIGAVGGVEYLFGARQSVSLGLRGTWFNLKANAGSIDASGIGMILGVYL